MEVAAAWQVLNDPEARARLDARRGQGGVGMPHGAPDDAYAAALSNALERAQDWLDRGVLPAVAVAWRGDGAEAIASALADIDGSVTPGPLPSAGPLAMRRAAALGRELNIALDPYGPRPVRFLRHRNGWSMVFGARGLERDVPAAELDDVVLRLLVDTALRCLLVTRLRLDPAHPQLLDEARRHDDAVVRRRRGSMALWSTVFLVVAAMMAWAKFAGPASRGGL